jgi:NADH-quinone oxidoreductase subunit C/D
MELHNEPSRVDWTIKHVELADLETTLLLTYEHLQYYWLLDICIVDSGDSRHFRILYFLKNPTKSETLIIESHFDLNQTLQSVAPIWKNAIIFENEAFEMFGIKFDFETSRKWLPATTEGYPLRKQGTCKITKAPISLVSDKGLTIALDFPTHKQSANFSVELEDDSIKTCQVNYGHHHFGLEKSLENLNYRQVLEKMSLLNFNAGLQWNISWAMLIEQANSIAIPDRAQGLRMIFLELSRIKNHLHTLLTIAYKIEYVSFFNILFYWYNRTIDQINSYTVRKNIGDVIIVGGVRDNMPTGWMAACVDYINQLEKKLSAEYNFLHKNTFWFDRLQCGKITRQMAMDFAVTGPVLRACGINHDLRKINNLYFYKDILFEVPLGHNGTIYDRFLVLMEEIFQSVNIIGQVLDNIPTGKILAEDCFEFYNLKNDNQISDDVLFKRSVEMTPPIKFQQYYHALEGDNGTIGIWSEFSDSLSNRVKCSSNSTRLLNLFEANIPGQKIDDLQLFWYSLGINMAEVER